MRSGSLSQAPAAAYLLRPRPSHSALMVLPPVRHQAEGAPLQLEVAPMGVLLALGFSAAQPCHWPGTVNALGTIEIKAEQKIVIPRPLVLCAAGGRAKSLATWCSWRRHCPRYLVVVCLTPGALRRSLTGSSFHYGTHLFHLLLKVHR